MLKRTELTDFPEPLSPETSITQGVGIPHSSSSRRDRPLRRWWVSSDSRDTRSNAQAPGAAAFSATDALWLWSSYSDVVPTGRRCSSSRVVPELNKKSTSVLMPQDSSSARTSSAGSEGTRALSRMSQWQGRFLQHSVQNTRFPDRNNRRGED